MNTIQDRDDRDGYSYRCSICGLLFNRDEIILEHELSPICDSCHDDHEQLDIGDIDLDGICDSREEIRELQELERRQI